MVVLRGEEVVEVRLNGEAGLERRQRRIGRDLRRVDVQLLPPHQPGADALLHNRLEEATQDIESVPLPDAAQAGVIGQRLAQVVAEGASVG